jgi:pimeloyl-ACP methyl ester carboxylesterase
MSGHHGGMNAGGAGRSGWWRGLLLGGLAALLALSGCLPIPQVRLELELPPTAYRSSPLTVQTEYLSVPGYPDAATPEHLNQSYALRYYRPEDTVDTILILVPGIFGGATSFDILARQLVAATPDLEVWAWDRRSSALEDRAAFRESLARRDPLIAYDYYVTNARTPEGFTPIPPAELRFMGGWGLELHLEDLHQVVLEARRRADTVVLGGHSLGAALVGYYAAYRGEHPRAGHTYLDGLILIEGTLGRTGGYTLDPAITTLLGILPDVDGLASGRDAPYLTLGLTPEYQARREALAQLARFRPNELSPGGFLSFPASNAAVLGILEGDRYGPATVFASSLGRAVGGVVSGNLTAFILGGRLSAGVTSVAGVADGYEMVTWEATEDARTDLMALARSWSTPLSNRSEWYFPLRLALDMALRDVRLSDDPDFVPTLDVTVPTLAIGAGRGLVQGLEGFAAYANARPGSLFSSYVLPGMTHMDILQADENPLVPLTQRWLAHLRR